MCYIVIATQVSILYVTLCMLYFSMSTGFLHLHLLGIGGILLKIFGPVRKSFFLNLNMLQFHLCNCVIIVHVLKNFQLYGFCSQNMI